MLTCCLASAKTCQTQIRLSVFYTIILHFLLNASAMQSVFQHRVYMAEKPICKFVRGKNVELLK